MFLQVSLKFVPMDPINNMPGLVQIMVGRQTGDRDKPSSEPMITYFPGAYVYASIGLNDQILYHDF